MYAHQLVQFTIMRSIILGENSPLDLAPLHADIAMDPASSSMLGFLRSYDLSRLLAPHTLNQTFPCHFFKGRLAWMSESKGHYRYFTRSYTGSVQSHDLLDLLTVYYEEEDTKRILQLLSGKSKVISLDGAWRKRQEERYLYNLNWIDQVEALSPLAARTLRPHVALYKALNEEGFRRIGPMFLSVDREAMFFTSARHLEKKLGISNSKIARVIPYLEELGLLARVQDEDIPHAYLAKSKEMQGKKKNRVNYYRMTDLRDHEAEILEKCEEFALKGIRYSSKR